MTPETQTRIAFDLMGKVVAEYKRGLITSVEFLDELSSVVKVVEEHRNDERI